MRFADYAHHDFRFMDSLIYASGEAQMRGVLTGA